MGKGKRARRTVRQVVNQFGQVVFGANAADVRVDARGVYHESDSDAEGGAVDDDMEDHDDAGGRQRAVLRDRVEQR